MTEKEIISLIERIVTTAQAKEQEAQVKYQQAQDSLQRQSAWVSIQAHTAVYSVLQALLEIITITDEQEGK